MYVISGSVSASTSPTTLSSTTITASLSDKDAIYLSEQEQLEQQLHQERKPLLEGYSPSLSSSTTPSLAEEEDRALHVATTIPKSVSITLYACLCKGLNLLLIKSFKKWGWAFM